MNDFKSLIKLISKNTNGGNIIAIVGEVGRGKTLLMSKLFNSPELSGGKERLDPDLHLTNLQETHNIFLDEGSYYSETVIKNFDTHLIMHQNRRLFLAVNYERDLWVRVREMTDLYIFVKGVDGNKTCLHLIIKYNDCVTKLKIGISPADFWNLEQWNIENQKFWKTQKTSFSINNH